MAFTSKAEINDAVKGARLEFGTFTLDAASIAAAGKGSETVTITGVKTGDLVFINGENLPAMLVATGAKVTATDTITVYLNNVYDATTAVDAASLTYSILIVHMS
jgi:hypothetical protein